MTTTVSEARTIRAPRGTRISCRGWQQEAALRMLMNNLDPEVAERPEQLIVYGGTGKAARNWECYDAIVSTLKRLKNDETLLVQSGKPVGVFKTHENAPRVLIANANLVPHWGTWDEFRRLDALGLTMYGQMTAGSAIYIGVVANAVDLLEKLIARGIGPDILTDQTSAHDELNGYVPAGMSYDAAIAMRESSPEMYIELSYETMSRHMRAMLELQRRGAITFDYGNNLRGQAKKAGVANAFDVGGFVPLFIRPLFCEGKGPFRWAALSGDPNDLNVTDEEILELFPNDAPLHRWIRMAQKRVEFQGLPARICWLGYGERSKAGALFNRLVAEKKVKAPIVIGRDHLDAGSVASPNRETEGMKDESDAIADWPILNALLN